MTSLALLARWLRSGYPTEIGERVLDAWNEPHRRYHTVEHLAHAFHVLDDNPQARAALEALTPGEREAVELAVWYHDIVYDPRARDNEPRSAARFLDDASHLGSSPQITESVNKLIIGSAEHKSTDNMSGLFYDVDLAILGEDPAGYTRYRHAVREEYGHVPSAAWRVGRRRVLRSFLRRPRIYTHLTAREAQARTNLTAELRSLRPATPLRRILDWIALWVYRAAAALWRLIQKGRIDMDSMVLPLPAPGAGTLFTPTPEGFVYHAVNGPEAVRWSDVLHVAAYKKDCYVVDQLCIELRTRDRVYLATEEHEGWTWLIECLTVHLPGAVPFHEWFMQVAFPAFEANYTVLFTRAT